MNKKMSKRQKDIKSKLMAAICMLLVSSIMMVSSTYAWFTLSTAPEVTGIQTAVGANGNLEMALIPTEGLPLGAGSDYGITTSVGDSAQVASVKNLTWGNLVDLTDNTFYGLDKLVLYPSELNVATWDDQTNKLNPTQISSTILSTPVYGSDGRISSLAANTTTSTYVSADKVFPQNTYNGVRAVGTASGMTDRQLAYRNSRSAASTAMAQAKTFASQSLNTNGAALANIALAHGVDANATHTQDDVTALLAIVSDLLGDADTTGVLEYIENAYKNYIIAYAASEAVANPDGDTATDDGMNDTLFKAFQSSIESAATLTDVKDVLTTNGITLPTPISTAIDALIATRVTVEEAQTGLEDLQDDGDTLTWSQISTPLWKLANTNAMKINGYEASTVKDKLNAIVQDVAKGNGLKVTIATGGGVYADVADHCGDYNAQIVIDEVSYGGTTLEDMPARMETDTTVDNTYGDVYLGLLNTAVGTAKEPSGTGQVMPITDFFGFIIDLGFKTNAAESNLLLQTAPVDRIYEEGGAEDTMGKGSTMTFTSTTTDFTVEQMAGLMDAIRIVFFDPADSNKVYATAKLDMTKNGETPNYTVVGGNTITANIYLYENTGNTTVYEVAGTDETATHIAVPVYRVALDTETPTHIENATYRAITGDEVGTHITDATSGEMRAITDGETGTHVVDTVTYTAVSDGTATHIVGDYTYREALTGETATHVARTVPGSAEMEKNQVDAIITALTQNTAKAVSCLVYLDGNYVTNADVAATAATSMTGSMNLQFSSSANLVPMNYTPLMNQGTTTGGENADSGESADAGDGTT